MAVTLCRCWWAPAVLFALVVCSASQSHKRLVFDLRLGTKRPKAVTASAKVASPSASGLVTKSGRRLRPARSQTHFVELGNYDNVQYTVDIQVGSTSCDKTGRGAGAGVKFTVVPDTGSSALWVPAHNCTHCPEAKSRYDPKHSCSWHQVGDRVTFRYGDGTTAEGVSLHDRVSIGDLEVHDQYLIEVDKMDETTHMQSDGILGLAHHYDDTTPGRTFVDIIFSQIPDLPKTFAFYMTGQMDEISALVFGDPDLRSYAKEQQFKYGRAYYMESTNLWLTSVWSMGWSGTGIEITFPDRGTLGTPALVDSGSSLIVLQPDIYTELMSELKWRLGNCQEMQEQSILMCDCPPANDLSGIPSLVINIIDEHERQFELCMSPDEFILESKNSEGQTTCVPSLQRGSPGQPVPLIFGMTFLRSFYTVFDVEQHQIGFARSKQSPLPAGARCSVNRNTLIRRTMWLVSVLFTIFSMGFACYMCCYPKGCFGLCGCMGFWTCKWSGEGSGVEPADATPNTSGVTALPLNPPSRQGQTVQVASQP